METYYRADWNVLLYWSKWSSSFVVNKQVSHSHAQKWKNCYGWVEH